MAANANRLSSSTTALAMLRRGWQFETPDERFIIYYNSISIIVIEYETANEYRYPLTADGFERMMAEVVNPPF